MTQSMCCQSIQGISFRNELAEHFILLKEYDPQPKNADGSIRRFLYRWDDGKNGVRRLVQCKHCGSYFLIQAYHLHKFSKYANVLYEDWYSIGSVEEADRANESYTGLQWELKHKPAFKCADNKIYN